MTTACSVCLAVLVTLAAPGVKDNNTDDAVQSVRDAVKSARDSLKSPKERGREKTKESEVPAGKNGPRLGEASSRQIRVGLIVTAEGGPCSGLHGTAPIPIDWDEQQVRVVGEDFSPFVKKVTYRMIGGTVKQMVVSIPFLPAGQEARAVVTLEITRRALSPPENTSELVIPEKLDRQTRMYLGPSPGIETTNARIRSLTKEILAAHQDADAWKKVEVIYDWVRENVEYKNGSFKGAFQALKDKTGDCEELSSLFIAMCRSAKIPARTVWVQGHCYPEFYLQDKEGQGYWFPCQAAGTREFGGISESRPIYQKGDNFSVPERKDSQRYVSEHLTGNGAAGAGKPKVQFLRESSDGKSN